MSDFSSIFSFFCHFFSIFFIFSKFLMKKTFFYVKNVFLIKILFFVKNRFEVRFPAHFWGPFLVHFWVHFWSKNRSKIVKFFAPGSGSGPGRKNGAPIFFNILREKAEMGYRTENWGDFCQKREN